ncbi:MAG: 4-hydroxybenzoate octaprenyltransferase, partial [Alphaproteobacteria bacterium]|nr:4-hydroxybenzoate octaprenyltransferase [Alphaproteobacteria bacterium]
VFVFLMYSVTTVCWILAGNLLQLSGGYYFGIVLIAALLTWQVLTLNIHESQNCLIRFKSNQWVGLIVWLSVLVGG